MSKWQAVRCLENNAPDYWIVTTRPIYQAPVLARCDTREAAELVALTMNAHPDLVARIAKLDNALRGLVNIATHPKSTKADIRMIAIESRAALLN